MRRNKPDSRNRHPWKAEAVEGHPKVAGTTIANWFTSVYDPDFPAVGGLTENINATPTTQTVDVDIATSQKGNKPSNTKPPVDKPDPTA